jgi:L-seryl-tRNA(Ser) seleniumtransferase
MADDEANSRPPQLGRLLERPEIAAWFPRISRPLAQRIALARVEAARRGFLETRDGPPTGSEDALVAEIVRDCAALERKRILPVLNATGILLHTNLGRSPLGAEAWEASRAANEGYSSVEFDLASGRRGRRGELARELASALAGAESAVIVNNNAAAVLLALSAIASGREVLISRGEQVQIGGGFRIPEILALSGARLVEVGTTNVTRAADYAAAFGPQTAAVLVVHRANFVMRGFVESPSLADLSARLPEGVALIVDQGSGCFEAGVPGETSVARSIRDGADLVCFSGDKLLGGPQSGIAAGRADLVSRLASHALARALRPGKTVLSLLEERLIRALNGEKGVASVPSEEELEAYGRRVIEGLPAGLVRLRSSTCALGGGSAPDEGFPSRALEVDDGATASIGGPQSLLARLREGSPPLIALVRAGRVRLDLAALRGADAALVADLLAQALGANLGMARGGRGEGG